MKTKEQAKLLKEARLKNNMSQAALGEILSIDKQGVSNMERGLTGIPAKRVKVLSETLRVPLKRFVEAYAADSVSDFKNRVKKGMG